jgi:hypothetical protein
MSTFKGLAGAVLGLGLIAAASPAAAQNRSRTGEVAEEIARAIRETASAVGTVTDAAYESVNGIRYRGRERHAIDRCAPQVERYGRMRIEDVRPYERRSFRVYGTVGGDGRYDDRYGSRDRYGMRSFTCTVRDDGRVKLKTKRLRY